MAWTQENLSQYVTSSACVMYTNPPCSICWSPDDMQYGFKGPASIVSTAPACQPDQRIAPAHQQSHHGIHPKLFRCCSVLLHAGRPLVCCGGVCRFSRVRPQRCRRWHVVVCSPSGLVKHRSLSEAACIIAYEPRPVGHSWPKAAGSRWYSFLPPRPAAP